MWKKCSSYRDQNECVASLANRCRAVLKKHQLPEADARRIALDNIAGIVGSSQMTLCLLDSWTIGDEIVRQVIPQLLGLTCAGGGRESHPARARFRRGERDREARRADAGAGTDYFATVDTAGRSVWVTLNGTLSGATTLEID